MDLELILLLGSLPILVVGAYWAGYDEFSRSDEEYSEKPLAKIQMWEEE